MGWDLLPPGTCLGKRCTLKHLLRHRRFYVLSAFLLTGLVLVTLPISYAVWREVLGVDAGVDTGDWPATTTPVASMTPTVSQTLLPPTDPGQQTATPVQSTDVPATELVSPDLPTIDPVPTEILPTNPPPTEEPMATESMPTESATEPPTEEATPEQTEN